MNHLFQLSIFLLLLLSSCKNTIVVPQWGTFEKEISSKTDYYDPFRDIDLFVTITRRMELLLTILAFTTEERPGGSG